MRILLSAYACEPEKGSEQEVGWQWAMHLAKHCDVTVLTRANNQANIQNALKSMPPNQRRPEFLYHEAPRCALKLKKLIGVRCYYQLWQKTAHRKIKQLVKHRHFDIFHHITFASYRYDTAFDNSFGPCIWGPVGGAELVPEDFLPPLASRAGLYERLRNHLILRDFKHPKNLQRKLAKFSLILASTKETLQLFNHAGVESQLMPTIGIDPEVWACQREARDRNKPTRLLYVGSFRYLKGVHWLLEALNKIITSNFTLSLVGSGPEEKNLQGLVERFNLNEKVHFLGRIPLAKMPQIYAQHDLFIFPSLHDSGGFAALEAMASGMPVICFDVGGSAISVKEGCGIRVPLTTPQRTVELLSSAIKSYIDGCKNIIMEGQNAAFHCKKYYSWDANSYRLIDFYQSLLQPQKG
jgi:glycosyltransferase involved in cell wall biosynthesis